MAGLDKIKVKCGVEGCQRYRSHPDDRPLGHYWVWMCGDHWRRIPKHYKRPLHRLNRLRKRYGDTDVLCLRWCRVWDRLVRMAGELPPAEITELMG